MPLHQFSSKLRGKQPKKKDSQQLCCKSLKYRGGAGRIRTLGQRLRRAKRRKSEILRSCPFVGFLPLFAVEPYAGFLCLHLHLTYLLLTSGFLSYLHQYLYNSAHAAAGATSSSGVAASPFSLPPLLLSNWQKQQGGNPNGGSFQRLDLVGVGISAVFFRVGVGNFFGHLDIDSGVENNGAFFAECVMFGGCHG